MADDAAALPSSAPPPQPRRILFFGWGAAAGRALEELAVYSRKGDCVVQCISHLSQASDCDLKEICSRESYDCTLTDSNDEALTVARSFAPDLIVSSSYRKKLPVSILNLCGDCINFHPSLLPRHRGCWSGFWAIFEGDGETGVTCHCMVEAFDEGPLLHQERIAISSEDTSVSIYKKLLPVTAHCAGHVFRCYFGPGLPHAKEQQGPCSYHFRKLPFDGLIQPEWSDEQVERFIRAMHFPPFAGAAVLLDGEQLPVDSVAQLHSLRRRSELGASATAALPPCKKFAVAGASLDVVVADVAT